jgi:hypothetical protein
MKDLKVSLENRPGTLADLSEALGKAGVNIEGICGFAHEDKEFITYIAHILVDDSVSATKVLKSVGIKVED